MLTNRKEKSKMAKDKLQEGEEELRHYYDCQDKK